MGDFKTSTHCRSWILSPQDLAEKCSAANQRAAYALKQYGASRVEVQPDGSLTYPGLVNGENHANEMTSSFPEPLEMEEELLIRRFYEQKIQQVCAAFSFPHKIQATAILYFKRFFLNWSVMEHDPKQIMLTCIYISCKVEEFHVSADELGKGIQQDPQAVLKNELTLLQGLNFELIVYSPYRSIDGFIYDLQNSFQINGDVSPQRIKDLREAAIFVTDSLMLTDAVLLYPPGQLALAALQSANMEENVVDFDRYLKNLLDRQHNKHKYTELIDCLNSIERMLKEARAPVEADVKRIDRKLKYCRNPHLQDDSRKRERKLKHKPKRQSHAGVAGAAVET